MEKYCSTKSLEFLAKIVENEGASPDIVREINNESTKCFDLTKKFIRNYGPEEIYAVEESLFINLDAKDRKKYMKLNYKYSFSGWICKFFS
jgi:hypothetical protein